MRELFAIRAGLVFDGERSVGPGMVLVDDGTVLDVDTSNAEPPAQATTIDLGDDASLLPGLIDAHVHLTFDSSSDVVGAMELLDDDELLSAMRAEAVRQLGAGITTVRDLGDRRYLSLALRDRLSGTDLVGPHLLAAGPPVTTRGGHCYFLGGEAEGETELRSAVRERSERGCDVVKVMVSGGNLTPGSAIHESQYDQASLRVIVEEAHRAGLPVAAHVHGARAVADAVESGVDTIEHVTFVTEDGVEANPPTIQRIVERGTTVSVSPGSWPGAPNIFGAMAQRRPAIQENLRLLIGAGARVIPGTDAGVSPSKPHGVLPYALKAMVESLGMSEEEALRSATSVAADALGLNGRKGRLVNGADADLVAVRGNPLSDIGSVLNVIAVFRAGRPVVLPTGRAE